MKAAVCLKYFVNDLGFWKDHRTSDHIFTLFSLINKYIKKGKYSYACFVDFQKVYYSIRRESLKSKLEQLGIKGDFLDIITSIYNCLTTIVSTPFSASLGHKQGDNLSTMFFKWFINDLPMLLKKHNA